MIAKKVITSGTRNSVNNNIERELNIRNPLEEPMRPNPCPFVSIRVATVGF
jgi:hypothetical protein